MPVVESAIATRERGRADGSRRRPPEPPLSLDGGGERPDAGQPSLSNARLGMLMLLGGETMFFGGLVAAFLQLRLSAAVWPPPSQPRLPVGLTALNTIVLLASSYTLTRALRASRAGDRRGLVGGLGRTALLGSLFLVVQGAEWLRLVRFGLTVSSGAYGATFYTLIGAHGVHVLAAVSWLAAVWAAARGGRATGAPPASLSSCAMYWHFVVTLWPILYVLVYLA